MIYLTSSPWWMTPPLKISLSTSHHYKHHHHTHRHQHHQHNTLLYLLSSSSLYLSSSSLLVSISCISFHQISEDFQLIFVSISILTQRWKVKIRLRESLMPMVVFHLMVYDQTIDIMMEMYDGDKWCMMTISDV